MNNVFEELAWLREELSLLDKALREGRPAAGLLDDFQEVVGSSRNLLKLVRQQADREDPQ